MNPIDATLGTDLFGEPILSPARAKLAQRFIMPPFSVLNAREGEWQERKRAWIMLGVKGEEGREAGTGDGDGGRCFNIDRADYDKGAELEKKAGACLPSMSRLSSENMGSRAAKAAEPEAQAEETPESELWNVEQWKDGAWAVVHAEETEADALAAMADFIRRGIARADCFRVPGPPPKKKLHAAVPGGGGPNGVRSGDMNRYEKERKAAARNQTAIPGGGTGANSAYMFKTPDGMATGEEAQQTGSATSVFDPVLCELMYKWFCPLNGKILDPFAGESTKGIIGAFLGHEYLGVELRPEQVAANRKQAESVGVTPRWVQGDSEKIDEIVPAGEWADFVWTSPPYYDLEIYSESEKDGSAFETYEKFMGWYERIFAACVARMKPNRFLAVKVGEIRDKKSGNYRNFVGDNITCFKRLGLHYYNEIILVTSCGSLPLRTGKQFSTSRKVGKTHQNILVFFKGDSKQIKHEFPALD